MSYIDDLNQAATEALAASSSATDSAQIMADVANGDENTTVTTANGEVKTLAKAIKDIIDSIETGVEAPQVEPQTLSAGQTTVSLTTMTTEGIAVYVEGSREFDFTVVNSTDFDFSQSFPQGTRIWIVKRDIEGAADSFTVNTSTGAQTLSNALNQRVIYVDTIADLDSLDAAKLADGQAVIVKRYKTGLEFGGGPLFWDVSGTETPDGGSVFQLTGVTTGRFKRPPTNRLSVFDYGNTLAGLNAAIEKGRSFTGGFAVEGFPDYQVETFSGAGPSFEYELDGFDDHVRKVLDGVRLRGDGANQLFFSSSSYAEILRCTFQDGDVGLHVGKFVNSSQKNHYTANRLGLWLNGVTAHREEGIYARGNTEAAVYISGGATENISLSGGAIEGNRGCAIKVDGATVTDSLRLTVNDVYFELDGDDGAGTPSIDIPSIGALVTFNGGRLSYNISTWTSGPYILGSRAVMNGTRVSGRMFVDSVSLVGSTTIKDLILRDTSSTDSELATLAFVPEVRGLEWGPGASGLSGHILSLPIKDAKSIRQSFDVAPTAHPYGARIVGTNPPTLTENTADDIGAGSWSRVEFTTSDGSPTNNAFRIGTRRDVTGLDYCVMTALMKVNQNQKFSIVELGGGTRFSQTLTFNTGKVYRVAFLINKSVSDLNDFRIYPRDTSAPILDIIVQHQADFATQEEASQYLDSIA